MLESAASPSNGVITAPASDNGSSPRPAGLSPNHGGGRSGVSGQGPVSLNLWPRFNLGSKSFFWVQACTLNDFLQVHFRQASWWLHAPIACALRREAATRAAPAPRREKPRQQRAQPNIKFRGNASHPAPGELLQGSQKPNARRKAASRAAPATGSPARGREFVALEAQGLGPTWGRSDCCSPRETPFHGGGVCSGPARTPRPQSLRACQRRTRAQSLAPGSAPSEDAEDSQRLTVTPAQPRCWGRRRVCHRVDARRPGREPRPGQPGVMAQPQQRGHRGARPREAWAPRVGQDPHFIAFRGF